MTSGSDNRIKIWSLTKVLVFEIKLDEGLKYTIWSNDLEILVLHRNKLLYLRDMHIDATGLEDDGQDLEDKQKFAEIDIKEQFQLCKKDGSKRKAEKEEKEEYLEANIGKRKAFSQVESKHTDPITKKEMDFPSYSLVKDKDEIKLGSSLSNNRKGKSSRKTASQSYTASMKAEE
jgi:hypothetical protein